MGAPDLSMIVDAVDASNRPIGTIARRDVFSARANFRTVHILILDPTGTNILLQCLPSDHGRSPSRLGSSVAGYLFAGESYYRAAVRKLKEELGLHRHPKLHRPAQIKMKDNGPTKFVGLFIMKIPDPSIIDHSYLNDHTYMAISEIKILVSREPDKFTKTFIPIFNRFCAI